MRRLEEAAKTHPNAEVKKKAGELLDSLQCSIRPDKPLFSMEEQGAREPFKDLPAEHIKALFERHKSKIELQDGDILMKSGDIAKAMYWIVEGEFLVEVPGRPTRGPGTVIGEIGVLEERGIRTATVRAKGKVKLLCITDEQFRAYATERTRTALQAKADERKKVWPR